MSQLRSLVERIERLECEIAELNSDKRDIYAEAKATGFDVKALKAVIAYRRKDPTERQEHDAIVETYLAELAGKSSTGTVTATRARAPAREAEPTKTESQLQVSVALARAGIDPFEMPDIPALLDRRAT